MRDPTLISSGGFPVELVLLLFTLLGIVGTTIWLTIMLTRREQHKSSPPPAGKAEEAEPSPPPVTPPLLTLERHSTGQWVIRIRGKVYTALEDVPDGRTQREVVAGLRRLAEFARSYLQRQKQATERQNPAPTATHSVAESSPAPQQPPPAAEPPSSPRPTPPVDLIARQLTARSSTPRQEPPRLRMPEAPPILLPPIDLAREIGEIVEQMQALNPRLAGRSIRLQNTSEGGIRFVIDGHSYTAVEQIPDPEIQNLIRAATKEWERR